MLEKIKEIIKDNEKNYDFNDYILNYCKDDELENIKDGQDLENYLESLNDNRQITDVEVIYYAVAMEYLINNDNSLRESIDIAIEYGYQLKNINSELLATLLKSQNNLNDYQKFVENCVKDFENYLQTKWGMRVWIKKKNYNMSMIY